MLPEFRFDRGEKVRVAPTRQGRDPGGVGFITAREVKEDERGTAVLYRVMIDGNPLHERAEAEEKQGRVFHGFWYSENLLERV